MTSSISPNRRQYDFCRYRLYKPFFKCAVFMSEQLHPFTTTDSKLCIKTWRTGLRNIQQDNNIFDKWKEIFGTEEPDYIKIIHIGICALETLSGLCKSTQTNSTIDHSYALWTYFCRVYYENPQQFQSVQSISSHIVYLRDSVDRFLCEQCTIDDNSTCPTTVTATNYRLDCLIHKLSALSCSFYKGFVSSNGDFAKFQLYLQHNCNVDPSFIISHILTAYSYLLGSSNTTIHPVRDGQSIVQLFHYLQHLSIIQHGQVDSSKINGREIICIREEIPIFITKLFSIH